MTTNLDVNLAGIANANVLVVGDVMLDQYWHGGTSRISPEAPVPVVKITKTDNRPGGAANVANNLIALGCKIKLLGIVGKDVAADILRQLLDEQKITHELITVEKIATVVKLRVLSRQQQMIRLDHEDDPDLLTASQLKNLYDVYATELANYSTVILSDYAKGVLLDPQPYIKAANALGIPVIVDPKNKDFSVYRGALLVKPNLAEFEAIVGKCATLEILEQKARKLLHSCGIETLVITRGSQGMSVISANKPAVHMPAYGGEVYDVTGAGDTVIAVLTAALAGGIDLVKAAHLSTVAAGIVVGKVGTSKVTLQELKQAVSKQQDLPLGVKDETSVQALIKISQANGEKVVFVNGCYDLLHYGHIRYFAKAKALGDRLVVGVNTDESIKRLKGNDRPVYNLEHRMEVLANLKTVDWVVPFAEDTPGRLVAALSPDILVKSSENFKSIEQIPPTEGVEHVLSNGGQIFLLDRTPDCSSTKMIESIDA